MGVKFDNEIYSGLVSVLECGNVKTSISNNLLGYPYVENKKPIRQKYQWKYWYFLSSFQIKFWLLEFIMKSKIGLMIWEVWMRVKKKKDGSKTFTYSGDLEKEF